MIIVANFYFGEVHKRPIYKSFIQCDLGTCAIKSLLSLNLSELVATMEVALCNSRS